MRWRIGLTNFDVKTVRKILLFPIGIVYGIVAALRRKWYQWHPEKVYIPDFPVICVGNLAVGGTGKTPHIEYLLRLLSDHYRLATLSRGYKRATHGYILAGDEDSFVTIGDEPMQLHQKFSNVQVAVCEQRAEGLRKLRSGECPPQVVLLDDAYQHVGVRAGYHLLLTEYANLYVHDFPLPAGTLREFRSAARRADMVIVTKCPADLSEQQASDIKRKLDLQATQSCYFSTYAYVSPQPLNSAAQETQWQKDTKVFLLTGIANPQPLYAWISSQYSNIERITFSDHHIFTEKDVERLCKKIAREKQNHVVITTEKDAVRLKVYEEKLKSVPMFVVPVQVEILLEEAQEFGQKIFKFIHDFQSPVSRSESGEGC